MYAKCFANYESAIISEILEVEGCCKWYILKELNITILTSTIREVCVMIISVREPICISTQHA